MRFRSFLSPVVLSLILAGSALAQSDPALVETEGGSLRGSTEGNLLAWKAIPYAAPPLGALRWRVPQPVVPWAGEREASALGPSCIQAGVEPVSEDCLTLNIWRPAEAEGPLPVMVWIHGGILARGGAALYPGNAMAAQGVVAVTINYRLGRLGFFAHPALAAEAPEDPRGNYGHLDQLAALEWVQRNIANFGGDPERVTIYGESAGGASVLGHLTSPMVPEGLFRAAILQSPGVPTPRRDALPLTPLAEAEAMAGGAPPHGAGLCRVAGGRGHRPGGAGRPARPACAGLGRWNGRSRHHRRDERGSLPAGLCGRDPGRPVLRGDARGFACRGPDQGCADHRRREQP
jgi:para-nitrobenzyl esterase